MKRRLFTVLWSWVLAFAVSFGAVMCLVTGFSMMVDASTVALWCGLSALLCSIFYSLPMGLVPPAALTLISVILWLQGALSVSVESILYRISRQYDWAYHWGVIKLNYLTADDMELQLWLVLCIIGALIAMGVTWSVCRGKTSLPAVIPAVMLLGACLVVTDTVPKLGYLYLLMAGILLLAMTGRIRRSDPDRANGATAMLIVPVCIFLLVMLAVVPQKSYAGKELPRQLLDKLMDNEIIAELFANDKEVTPTGTSVDSGIVNLKTVGVRLESYAEVMQLLTDYDGTIYLRGRALDRYDGTSWTDSGVSTADLNWPSEESLQSGGEVMITTRYAHRMLYLPYYVQSRDLTDMTRGLENSKKLTQYSFSCARLDKNNDIFKIFAQAPYDQTWDASFFRHLHMTPEVWEWAEPMVKEIVNEEDSIYEMAQAIGRYVRSSAEYSTKTYRMPSGEDDFARWFLEESDTGYCVHFATAATVLLQAAGIPARYVTGYTVDVRASYPTAVRAKDAHAWAEYWLPGYGWMILEATPGTTEAPDETEAATEPTQSQEETLPQETQEASQQAPQKTPAQVNKKLLWSILLSFAVVLLIAAVIVQRVLRLRKRDQALTRGDANQRALACWALIGRMQKHLKEAPDGGLLALAQKAKFSRHALTEAELTRFTEALEQTQAKLKKRSVFHRFYYRVILVLY